MAVRRRRVEDDPERGLAPCYSMILTPEQVKIRFVVYTTTLEKFFQKNSEMDIRAIAKRWPRRPISLEYAQELRIAKRFNIDKESRLSQHCLKVKVVNAKGPMKFTFQLSKNSEEFTSLEEQMKTFYDDSESNYRNPNYVVASGVFDGSFYVCFSRRRRQWCRCLCHTDLPVIKPKSTALVTLVDYGIKEVVYGNQLRPLLPSFCTLASQGYIGTLEDWFPTEVNPAREVTVPVIREFAAKVIGKTFYAEFCKIHLQTPIADQTPTLPDVVMNLYTLDKRRIGYRNDEAGRQIIFEEDDIQEIFTDDDFDDKKSDDEDDDDEEDEEDDDVEVEIEVEEEINEI